MRLARLIPLAGGLLSGAGLMLAVLQLSAADQPAPALLEPDPCEGQTDQECGQTINALRSEGNKKYTEWVNNFIASGQDPRSLPRSPSSALAAPPPPTLDLAVQAANTIVVGAINDVDFEVVPPDDPSGHAFVRTKARVSIESTLKGDPVKEITILQFGGPEPGSDWESGRLLYLEAAPLLLKGDRALLFLKKDDLGYYVQAWTGTYLLDKNDKLDALAGNPFEAAVEKKTLSEFTDEIRALVAAQAASRPNSAGSLGNPGSAARTVR